MIIGYLDEGYQGEQIDLSKQYCLILINYINRQYRILKNLMDNLRVDKTNIFPSSISEISLVNQESQFTYEVAQKPEKLSDYQIKINGQQSMSNINQFQSQIERLHYLQHHAIQGVPPNQDDVPHAERFDYKDKITGYDTMKDKFNDEEILRAFKIIDITKDDVITQEDIMMILDYLKEQYTIEEVQEMINMASTDKTTVYFENFKEIAKGEIMPLAAYKIPNQKLKSKTEIFNNVQSFDLMSEEPSQILEGIENGSLSIEKHGQLKKNKKKVLNQEKKESSAKVIEGTKELLNKTLPIKDQQLFNQRKRKYNQYLVLANRELLRKFITIPPDAILSQTEISNLLDITFKEAKQLYPVAEGFYSLFVLMEAITYSQLKNYDKFELSLAAINPQDTITFKQIEHVLEFLKGKDSSINKKLKALFYNRQLSPTEKIKKLEALEFIGQYLHIFII